MSAKGFWDLIEDLAHLWKNQEEGIRVKLKLSPAEYRALRMINTHEVISCQDFAGRLRLSPSRGSRVIDRMVERGFLVRSDCDSDRRCKSLLLTPRGLSLHRKIRAAIKECEAALLQTNSRARMISLKKELGDFFLSLPRD